MADCPRFSSPKPPKVAEGKKAKSKVGRGKAEKTSGGLRKVLFENSEWTTTTQAGKDPTREPSPLRTRGRTMSHGLRQQEN